MPSQPPRSNRAGAKMRRLSNASSMLKALGLSLGLGMLPAQAQNKRPPHGKRSVAATAPAPEAPSSPAATSTAIPTAPPAVVPTQALPTPTAIAVPISESRILLALGRREIRLERDGKIYGPWPVAIGDPKTPTPTGTFAVKNKVVNPQYASTRTGKVNPTVGPNGPLGDRWIGFKTQGPNQFGIHGTPWPTWVDQRAAVTNGCVRMKHEHVRKLFDLVDLGTAVVITR